MFSVTLLAIKGPPIVGENHMDGRLPSQQGTANNPQTRWRPNQRGAPVPDQHRQPISDLTPSPPRTPPWPPGDDKGAQFSQINCVPARSAYLHPALPNAQHFNLDAYAKDSNHNTDFNSHLLTDQETLTG
jgi:hypothetical protein